MIKEVKKLDDLFSQYVRLLAGGYCRKCKKYFGFEKLHNAHFHSRRKHSVRWDSENTTALCCGCHRYLDDNALAKVSFFLELLGNERFEALNKRAEDLTKVDKENLLEEYKGKIKLLKGG